MPALVLAFAMALPGPTVHAASVSAPADVADEAAVPGSRSLELEAFDDKSFVEARKSGSPIGLFFEADGCAPCQQMREKTFRAPAVLEAAAGIRIFRVSLTEPDRQTSLLQKSFRVIGAPTVILFAPDGKERGRRFGFIPPEDFAKMLGESRKPSEST